MKSVATKRALCIILTIMLVFSSFYASASSIGRSIVGASGQRSLEDNFSLGQSGDSQFIQVLPDEEIRIPLTADLFEWADGTIPTTPESISRHDLKRSRIKMGTIVRAGSEALEYIQISTDDFSGKPFFKPGTTQPTSRTCYISIKFAEFLEDVEPVDFHYDIRLSINGRSYDELCYSLVGTCDNDTVKVGYDVHSSDIYDGTVLETTSFVPKVMLNLGSGVKAETSLNSKTRYYGVAYYTDSVQAIREEWPDVYPTVKMIYFLHTVNLGRKGVCRINLSPPTITEGKETFTVFYVYDKDMKYLGKSNETLPYSDYYFLSTEEIPTMELTPYEDSLIDAPFLERDINL